MSALGTKLRRLERGRIAYWCPGCGFAHIVGVEQPLPNGHQWNWNGNPDAPTFSPSINSGPNTRLQCHHYVEDGRIRFLSDCSHALASQTVPLPDWPQDEEP